jgi:S1-C subfamily serine protease
MKKIVLLLIAVIFQITQIFGQKYETSNPYVSYSSSNYCKIVKVIVNQNETKVLIEVTGQRKRGAWVSFTSWTIMVPSKDYNISNLRKYDLNIPKAESGEATYVALWLKLAEKKKVMQQEAIKNLGNNLINNLGSYNLNTRYNVRSKTGQKYRFWLNFDALPPGVEDITIIELIENGFEWSGIKIKNPDTTPKTKWDEITLKIDWQKNGITPLEGIYENTMRDENSPKYRLALKYDKTNEQYQLIYLSGATNSIWKTGNIKAHVFKTASPNIFKVKWYMGDKTISEDLYISFEQGLMKIIWTNGNSESLYLKLYPTSENDLSNSSVNKGSGTGFAISSNGIIATNYHVIENAQTIKVRGVNSNFNKIYKAKVLVSDKNNDLALIQIIDDSFTSLDAIPYVLKTKLVNAGENIFALGYPLRAAMGDEIKLTNGIVSSKTGFQGDITSYQVSAPVQPGNSGGPLFDANGNVIGIINAKLTIAENASYAVKASYLMNLIELLNEPPNLTKFNALKDKSLASQVKIVNKFVYIIETE